jgi:hypothetical protein
MVRTHFIINLRKCTLSLCLCNFLDILFSQAHHRFSRPTFQIHLSITGRTGEMAVDFVAHADAQTVSVISAPKQTFPAACQYQTGA